MAEYRAYQYIVTTKSANQTDLTKSKTAIINSSLAPTAYTAYHGGNNLIKIELINSWPCPGSTANQQICKPPKPKD